MDYSVSVLSLQIAITMTQEIFYARWPQLSINTYHLISKHDWDNEIRPGLFIVFINKIVLRNVKHSTTLFLKEFMILSQISFFFPSWFSCEADELYTMNFQYNKRMFASRGQIQWRDEESASATQKNLEFSRHGRSRDY